MSKALKETREFRNIVQIQITVILILFAVLYTPVASFLVETWRGRDDYSHGVLVPFISFYFIWFMRHRLRQLQVVPSILQALPFVLVAGLMLVIGKLGSVVILQDVSLPIMTAGLVFMLLGKAYLKVLALPIAYLFFMIPVFPEGSDGLHQPFQFLAAKIGVWVLLVLGFPVFQESQYIYLPEITLEIARACSGIRYLLSIFALGIPLAYFTQRTWPRAIGLVAFAVVVAILANGLRVALIGMWAYYGGEVFKGPYEVLQGMFVAWAGFVALLLGGWLLGKGPKGGKEPLLFRNLAPGVPVYKTFEDTEKSTRTSSNAWNTSWLVASLFLVAIGFAFYFHRQMFVAWTGFVALVGVAWLLGRSSIVRKVPSRFEDGAVDWLVHKNFGQTAGSTERRGDSWNAAWATASLFLMVLVATAYFPRISPVPLDKGLRDIPITLGEWSGKEVDPARAPFRSNGAQEEMVRVYRNKFGHEVGLYIAYFEVQEQGQELVSYLSNGFYRRALTEVVAAGHRGAYRVNRVLINDGGEGHSAIFWYEVNGRQVADPYHVKLWSIWDSLYWRSTNGALVLVWAPSKLAKDNEKMLWVFIQEIAPTLHSHLWSVG